MLQATVQMATGSPEETMAMAAAFASTCEPDDVIGLQGTLGAGKTCFVKGLARGLGVGCERRVISPTFVLMRRHPGRLVLYHFDAYRLHDSAAMEEIGCAETFESGGVSVVEWADHVRECLPPRHFLLTITVAGAADRRFTLTAEGQGPAGRMEAFRRALSPWTA